jgi:ATP-dependent RNA helicase SUPV3L1/SUV3
MEASGITALLGPTNTGKTHRAWTRMLEHRTGMIGLPLRLLAREIYDKTTAQIGESEVALVTGEERRVPRNPSYWICTVEAMPTTLDVEFLAVDEIQLAAHEQRGHVFTSRLLGARGTKETWFLGADTMRGVIAELTPTAKIVTHPRLSELAWKGAVPLSKVPPRSAVVAFSMTHVYELGERLRAKKGGAAIVLGGLSPRTRNAQVAMFQAGEVDYLVATDAIGMGLNLNVSHVAFSALRKFDGQDVRQLSDAELSQIAGRAGRYVQNGTFGTLSPLALPMEVARAIESHRFPPVTRVRYRNDMLDFSSTAALIESLTLAPTRHVLRLASGAEDALALAALLRDPHVAMRARDAASVKLLWDVCQVPDYRKLLFEAHVAFLQSLFIELATHGRLRQAWVEEHVKELESDLGDVDTLVARIAQVRTWTYVANRDDWLDDPRPWRARTREFEDRLSDALHQRLVSRFVDGARGRPKQHARPSSPGRRGADSSASFEVPRADPSHPFAKLVAFSRVVPAAPKSGPTLERSWVEDVVNAPHDAFALSPAGKITHVETGRALAVLTRGTSVALPDVKVLSLEDLGGGAHLRLQRRVHAYARDVVSALVGLPSRSAESRALRGLAFHLEQGLGTAPMRDVGKLVHALEPSARQALQDAGVIFGSEVVYVRSGLVAQAIAERVALATVFFGEAQTLAMALALPRELAPRRDVSPAALLAVGYLRKGRIAVRVDLLSEPAKNEGRESAAKHEPGGSDLEPHVEHGSNPANDERGHVNDGGARKPDGGHAHEADRGHVGAVQETGKDGGAT